MFKVLIWLRVRQVPVHAVRVSCAVDYSNARTAEFSAFLYRFVSKFPETFTRRKLLSNFRCRLRGANKAVLPERVQHEEVSSAVLTAFQEHEHPENKLYEKTLSGAQLTVKAHEQRGHVVDGHHRPVVELWRGLLLRLARMR